MRLGSWGLDVGENLRVNRPMGCGCGGSVGVRRSAGVAPMDFLRRGPVRARARIDGHCCLACSLGEPCGSLVAGPVDRSSGLRWGPPLPMRAAGAAVRSAGDPPDPDDPEECPRRRGESVTAYQARCGLSRGGMDSELWDSMSPVERRQWLRDTARNARVSQQDEARLIREAVSGGFDTLREILRTVRDIRIAEIRQGTAVQIAQIRGVGAREREFLENWADPGTSPGPGPGSGPGSFPPVVPGGPGDRFTGPPQSGGGGGALVPILGLALLAKVAGVF